MCDSIWYLNWSILQMKIDCIGKKMELNNNNKKLKLKSRIAFWLQLNSYIEGDSTKIKQKMIERSEKNSSNGAKKKWSKKWIQQSFVCLWSFNQKYCLAASDSHKQKQCLDCIYFILFSVVVVVVCSPPISNTACMFLFKKNV